MSTSAAQVSIQALSPALWASAACCSSCATLAERRAASADPAGALGAGAAPAPLAEDGPGACAPSGPAQNTSNTSKTPAARLLRIHNSSGCLPLRPDFSGRQRRIIGDSGNTSRKKDGGPGTRAPHAAVAGAQEPRQSGSSIAISHFLNPRRTKNSWVEFK